MNRLKSIFISSAITIWAVFSYFFIAAVVSNGLNPWLIGVFIISILPLSFFMVLMSMNPVARTNRSLKLITILIIAGTSLTLVGVFNKDLSIEFSSISGVSLILWILYIYWYSQLPDRKASIEVGSLIPDLLFFDGKNEVSTNMFQGKKVLYMFYRGNWCPLCMAQIKEISSQYKELESRGVEVLLISPQPAGHSKSLAKKMDVNFHFLTDEGNKMARKLKIDHDHGTPLGMEVFGYTSETVLPTVIITNEDGKVIFLDQTDNYRVRPKPETFLNFLDAN